jgi:hypothetical protein
LKAKNNFADKPVDSPDAGASGSKSGAKGDFF